MRDALEQLLRAADSPSPERAQLRWDEYRAGADSTDPAARAAADAAFATLLVWYGASLYRHVWGFVRSDAADDVLQDVLRKLHQNRRNPRLASFHANVLPWLRRVAIRGCVEAHRKAARRRRRESLAARPETAPPAGGRAELQEAVAAALAKLPAEQQEAVALHFFEGLTRQEAAAALGINRDTFSARLNAALDRLRKVAHAPAAVALGVVIDVPAVLAAPPPALPSARLGELAANALSAPAGWTTAKTATLILLALTVGGGAAAGWLLTREEQPRAPAARLAPNPEPPRAAAESLQARNERIARAELVEPLRELLQRFYPADNPVRLHSLRAFGSEVEVEFRPERPPHQLTGLAARLRGRYCTFRRQLTIHGQQVGEDRWYWMDPEKPLGFRLPGLLGGKEFARGRDEYAAAERLFACLPRDPRAEADMLRFLFGPPGGELLLLPTGMSGASGFPGGVIVRSEGGGLFVRNPSGKWRYAGEAPGWFPVVAGDRVFCVHNGICSRRLDEPDAPWVKWCDLPPTEQGERRGHLFFADGRLQMGCDPGFIASRPLDDPTAGWSRAAAPVRYEGLAEAGEMLFGNDGKRLYARPATDPTAPWVVAGPWPGERYRTLVADGDRLLALDWEPGPIYARSVNARSVNARPDEQWEVVGQVRDVYQP